MSKEQTPIEQIIELIMTDSTATLNAKALCDNVLKSYLVVEKEHIQAKVLEALEREVIKIAADLQYQMFIITSNPTTVGDLEYLKIEAFNRSKDYYETEVKPKYEKERKQRSN